MLRTSQQVVSHAASSYYGGCISGSCMCGQQADAMVCQAGSKPSAHPAACAGLTSTATGKKRKAQAAGPAQPRQPAAARKPSRLALPPRQPPSGSSEEEDKTHENLVKMFEQIQASSEDR